jgi:hypothetical protein
MLQCDIAGLIDARASKPIAIGHGAGGLLAEIRMAGSGHFRQVTLSTAGSF